VLNGEGRTLHLLLNSSRAHLSANPRTSLPFVSSLTTPTLQRFCCSNSYRHGASGDDNQLPSSRPVSSVVRAMCARCICASQTWPFRPPGLSRERDRKPAISITGKENRQHTFKTSHLDAGIGAGRRSSADIDRLILQDRDTGGQIVEE
jgi:hypothetical protein